MNHNYMAESSHRITRPELPDYREQFRESDIKSAVAFLLFHFLFQYVVFFLKSRISIRFGVIGAAFGVSL
ncbi:hypothetical protein VW41_05340 [Klebsiella michiganensis]|nr:hypothetical protein VW41_05340 [Klebsiella michiganensis]